MPPITAPPIGPSLGAIPAGDVEALASGEQVPSLERIVALARAQGPRVLLGRAQIAIARAGYAGARLPPVANPYLELTADRALGVGGNGRDPNLLAQLWLPVELFGQRGRRIEETDAAVRLTEKSLELSRALATGEAVRAYGDVVVGAARLKVLGDLMEVSRSEATSYEERYSAGDATIQDANLARVDLARYAVLLEEAKGTTAAALLELNRLTDSSFATPPAAPLLPPVVDQRPNADDLPAVQTPRAEADYHSRVKERFKREALGPVSLILTGGRDEVGDAKLGGGLGYTFPVFRRNQGEQARADAERSRALVESRLNRQLVESRLTALAVELTQVRRALDLLRDQAEPAAVAAVDSATAMRRAGKGELLAVLTSRRDLALVQLRRLELATREWDLLAELTAITGKIQ
jgi:cobalt-zinc-cadmium efflux system outer membrane protein